MISAIADRGHWRADGARLDHRHQPIQCLRGALLEVGVDLHRAHVLGDDADASFGLSAAGPFGPGGAQLIDGDGPEEFRFLSWQ